MYELFVLERGTTGALKGKVLYIVGFDQSDIIQGNDKESYVENCKILFDLTGPEDVGDDYELEMVDNHYIFKGKSGLFKEIFND